MTRRITRTLCQAGAFVFLVTILVFLADTRYRVLPAALHSHLPSHHAGSVLTDIDVAFCSSANPFSSCRLDADAAWQRVEKDLYLGSGWLSSAWLHVKRKREEELTAQDRVVLNVRVGRLDPGVADKEQRNERWESRPGGLWVLRSSRRHDSDSVQAVTAVDVLFGADAVDPRPGWTLASSPLLLGGDDKAAPARVSVRHGPPKVERHEVVPRVRKDGRFKILQVSDAHLSTGTGVCRDAIDADGQPSLKCEADPRTLDFVERILDDEKPDLVVLSGDQIEGPAAPDSQTAIFKMAAPLIERGIPFASIFGNHDNEGSRSLSREAQMSLLQTLPYSLSHPGPEDVAGVGNYYVEVLAPSSEHSALTIYLLDTHGLTPDEKRYKGYDWLKPSQVEWFRSTADALRKSKAHSKYSHIHLDMAFIHIPLPEYAERGLLVAGGEFREGVTAPAFNSHFYDALAAEGIVAVGCGHDHVNDYCALRPANPPSSAAAAAARDAQSPGAAQHEAHRRKNALGPWMCYAGGSGFGGYGGYGGFHRRVRVWEVDTNAGRMVTWTRLECCGEEVMRRKNNEVVLVEGGAVVAPPVG